MGPHASSASCPLWAPSGRSAGSSGPERPRGAPERGANNESAGYATPQLSTLAGRHWGFAFTRGGLLAFEPRAGTADFFFPWRARKLESVNAASPVIAGATVLVSESYGPGSALIKVKPGSFEVMRQDPPRDQSLQQHWATPVLRQGTLYASSGQSSGEAELRAVDHVSGKVLWRQKALGRANLTYADGHLMVLTETGSFLVVKPTPERFVRVSEFNLGAGSANDNFRAKTAITPNATRPRLLFPAWNALVLSNGRLYLRGKDQIVCLEVGR